MRNIRDKDKRDMINIYLKDDRKRNERSEPQRLVLARFTVVKTARTTFAARKKTLCSDGMKRKKMA